MIWKSILWGCFLLFLTNSCSKKATTTLNLPDRCALAMKVNLWEIAKKAELIHPQSLKPSKNLLTHLTEKIPQSSHFQNLNIISSGINFFEPTYLFIISNENQTENTLIITGKIAQSSQFSNSIQSLFAKGDRSLKSLSLEKIEILSIDSMAVAWNQSYFAIALGEQNPSIETIFLDIFERKNVTIFPGFDLLVADKNDVSVWVNNQWINSNIKNQLKSLLPIPFLPQDTFVNISISFNNGGFSAFIVSKSSSMNENFLSFLKKQLVQQAN